MTDAGCSITADLRGYLWLRPFVKGYGASRPASARIYMDRCSSEHAAYGGKEKASSIKEKCGLNGTNNDQTDS